MIQIVVLLSKKHLNKAPINNYYSQAFHKLSISYFSVYPILRKLAIRN